MFHWSHNQMVLLILPQLNETKALLFLKKMLTHPPVCEKRLLSWATLWLTPLDQLTPAALTRPPVQKYFCPSRAQRPI